MARRMRCVVRVFAARWTASASCGELARHSAKRSFAICLSSHAGETQRTVVLRALRSSSSAVSPKWSPGPSVATTHLLRAPPASPPLPFVLAPSPPPPLPPPLPPPPLLPGRAPTSQSNLPCVTRKKLVAASPWQKTVCPSAYVTVSICESIDSYLSYSTPSPAAAARAIIGKICASSRRAAACRAVALPSSACALAVCCRYSSFFDARRSSLRGTTVTSASVRHATVVSCTSDSSESYPKWSPGLRRFTRSERPSSVDTVISSWPLSRM
mmetsp:Transcript_63465/g.169126  ORF Transcript_63465/g.169126 Transcript_63465/m.169126 type:complete len:270 (-) Transcript_63465:1393-2202(-)